MTGEEIRAARELAGLTQAELGDLLDVSGRTVGNWERGTTIPRNRQAQLEAILSEHMKSRTEGVPLAGASDAELLAEIARRFSRGRGVSSAGRDTQPDDNTPPSTAQEQDAQGTSKQSEKTLRLGDYRKEEPPPVPETAAAYHADSEGKRINKAYETLGEEPDPEPDYDDNQDPGEHE